MTDYSNTIIYKITCKNPDVIDTYVGHTIDFVKRCYAHKNASAHDENKLKLYETIRANGGWNNWKMEIIHYFSCNNANEARIKEQEYYELLKANLNSIEPHRTHDNLEKCIDVDKNVKFEETTVYTKIDYSQTCVYEIVCKNANVATKYIGYTTNLIQRRKKHKKNCLITETKTKLYETIRANGGWNNWDMRILQIHECKDVDEVRKIICNYPSHLLETDKHDIFRCEACVFESDRKSHYDNHCRTQKHIANEMNTNSNKPVQQQSQITELTQIVIDLAKQHHNLQQQMKQMIKSNQNLQNIVELYKSVV